MSAKPSWQKPARRSWIDLWCDSVLRGLDESKALYEWKYGKQLLYTQLLKEQLGDVLEGAQGLSESMSRLRQLATFLFRGFFGIEAAVEGNGGRTRRCVAD